MAMRVLLPPSEPVQLHGLPPLNESGIYFLYRDGDTVYVGQARCVRKRIGQHLAEGLKRFDSVAFVPCELKALDRLEAFFIRKHVPEYNKCAIAKDARLLLANGIRFEGDPPLRLRRRSRAKNPQRPVPIAA